MSEKKYTLLITSAGSLVGQNIFDTIDGRREKFHVSGLNTVTDNPVMFRSDELFLCPPTKSAEYLPFLTSIIERIQPDFVLPGRDADVGVLARLKMARKDLADMIPVGTPELADMMDDKAASARFAEDHGLPFAETMDSFGKNPQEIGMGLEKIGYPMIAKPRNGFGSNGVKYIEDEQQAVRLSGMYPDLYVFQSLIDPPAGFQAYLDQYKRDIEAGIPAFFQLPDDRQYAGQCMIGTKGNISDIFCSKSYMLLGRCERLDVIDHAQMKEIVRQYASTMASAGWVGPFNLQGRMGPNGFTPIEMNGRFTGGTSSRSWMGFDEIRLLYLAFKGIDIGTMDARPARPMGPVHRVFTDMPIKNTDMADLSKTGHWMRKTS
jgi:hypothetical protein